LLDFHVVRLAFGINPKRNFHRSFDGGALARGTRKITSFSLPLLARSHFRFAEA
jgi:hypothetical protein